MIIPEALLVDYGANFLAVQKDELIFMEDTQAIYYYQVINGSVKMSSFSDTGQEFIQGIFRAGQSFGEPSIFGNFNYPNNAVATENSKLARLPKQQFLALVKDHPDIQLKFLELMSNRLRYKAILLKEISSYYPDHIVMTLLNYLRDSSKTDRNAEFCVPYTRQQIADMTGLRVETVIRTVKKLQKEGKLDIRQHKIYLK